MVSSIMKYNFLLIFIAIILNSTSAKSSQSLKQCTEISPSATYPLSDTDKKVRKHLEYITHQLNYINLKELAALFHPQLKLSQAELNIFVKNWSGSLGGGLEISLRNAWKITPLDLNQHEYISCADDLSIYPHRQHDLQYAAWFQLSGQKELGRVFLTLTPIKDKWYISFYHFQRWTHQGIDYHDWMKRADENLAKGKKELSFIQLEIAKKLSDGTRHFIIPDHLVIEEIFKVKFPKNPLFEPVQKILSEDKILNTQSLLTEKGQGGLLIRFQLPKELSSHDINEHCASVYKKLNEKLNWIQELSGIRCSYVLPGEPTFREGKLGSLFIANKKNT